MALSSTIVKQFYQGNGSNVDFAIPFDYFNESEITVYIRDETDPDDIIVTLRTEGAMQDYTITGQNPPSEPLGTTVTFNTAPTADQKVVVVRALPLTQIVEYIGTGRFPAESHEEALDRIVAQIQQLQEQLNRTVMLSITEQFVDEPLTLPDPVSQALIGWNVDADALQNYTLQDIADLIVDLINAAPTELGLPTDLEYGGQYGAIAGVAEGDSFEDAFDKVETTFGLLVPPPPDLLSAKTLIIPSAYTANAATTGTAHYCTDDTTPIVTPGQTEVLADSFRDGKTGILSAEMDAVEVGSITLSAADDTGVDGELEILFDFDPYDGVFGQQGFWKGLVARINSAALSVGSHIAEMIHSVSGTASRTFFVDDPTTSVISNDALTFAGTASYKSGIPGAAQGQNINVTFDVDDFCGTHYNATRIASGQSPQTGALVNDALGGPYIPADTFAADIDLPVAASAYSEDVVVTMRAYNSKGDIVSDTIQNDVRVDTVGTETRVLSSTGQYPAASYGGAFNSQTDVLTGNKELQYSNGSFRYPPLTDYTGKLPAGPDYSGLTADAHNSMRWATFSLGSVSAVTSITFTINGVANFGATTLISGIELYLRVDGGTPTTGWVDANAAYPGVGNPTADGDPALDVGASTVTSRRVTFGAAVKTGTAFVRIGIPSGSTKTFTSIS